MRRLTVRDRGRKASRILILSDIDLLFCVPYTALSALTHIAQGLLSSAIRRAIVQPLLRMFRNANLPLIPAIVLLFPLVAAAEWLCTVAGPYSLTSLAIALAVLIYGMTIRAKVLLYYDYLEDPENVTSPPTRLSAADSSAYRLLRAEARSIPLTCVCHEYDRHVIHTGALRTVVVLPALCFLAITPEGWLALALAAYFATFVFNNFERIEHIAAHTRCGKLLMGAKAPWALRLLEWLRRHILWPLFGWYPNYYYVTHTLHHHVENNGPADWQSTIRYSRHSLSDCCKLITWIGVNRIVPVDTAYYLFQRRRFRILRLLAQGWLMGCLAFLGVAYVSRPLCFILLWLVVFSGCGFYQSVLIWHGFHDAGQPDDLEASTNDIAHYVHHKKPRIHLWDVNTIKSTAGNLRPSSRMALLSPSWQSARRFWKLQAILWEKDFERASQCIVTFQEGRCATEARRGIWSEETRENGRDRPVMEVLTAGISGNPPGQLGRAIDSGCSKVLRRIICKLLPSTEVTTRGGMRPRGDAMPSGSAVKKTA